MSEDNLHCRSLNSTAQKCNLTTRNQDNVMKSFYSKLKNFAIFTTLLFIALFFLPDYVLGNQIISYGAILFISMLIVLIFFYFIGLEKTKTTPFLLDSTDVNYSLFSSTSFSDVNRSIISVTSIISMVVSFFILVAYIIRRRNFYEISTKLQKTKDDKKELFTVKEKDGKKEWSPKSTTFEEMDTNNDGIISKKEFADWYRKNVQGGANDAQEDENEEEKIIDYFPGGPPQNIFQLGQDQILLISTIPIVTMAIRYKRLLKKGYNFGLFIAFIVCAPVFFFGLLPLKKSDPVKFYFLVSFLIAFFCLIQVFVTHTRTVSLLNRIETEINNNKIWSEFTPETVVQNEGGGLLSSFNSEEEDTTGGGGGNHEDHNKDDEENNDNNNNNNNNDNNDNDKDNNEDTVEGFAVVGGGNIEQSHKKLCELLDWYKEMRYLYDPEELYPDQCSINKSDYESEDSIFGLICENSDQLRSLFTILDNMTEDRINGKKVSLEDLYHAKLLIELKYYIINGGYRYKTDRKLYKASDKTTNNSIKFFKDMSWTDNVGSPDITNPGCLMAAPVVPVAQDDNSLKIWYIHAYLRNRIALTNVFVKQWTAYPSSYDKLTFNTSTNSFSFVPTLPDIKAGIPTDEQGFYELFNKDFKKLNNPDYLKSIKQLCGYNELGGYRNYKC